MVLYEVGQENMSPFVVGQMDMVQYTVGQGDMTPYEVYSNRGMWFLMSDIWSL